MANKSALTDSAVTTGQIIPANAEGQEKPEDGVGIESRIDFCRDKV